MTRGFFVFFLVSGFCGLVYEVVWLRLAMAQFGVTTPLVSIVLSVFMGGLALGSWGAGVLSKRYEARPQSTFLRLYAGAELVVAASRDLVPAILGWGRRSLEGVGSGSWGSGGYHLASALWISAALLPFCVAMGATFPLAMGAIRRSGSRSATRSFSLLYLANVIGAALGTLVSAFILIEVFGFRGTLAVAAALNAVLAAGALLLSLTPSAAPEAVPDVEPPAAPREAPDGLSGTSVLLALFSTGLVSMALEVVWVRMLTPYLGNIVYAFAVILALYLVATFASSGLYRWRARRGEALALSPAVWGAMGASALLILAATDPRWGGLGAWSLGLVRAFAGIVPFCGLLGYATPLLVDRWSAGEPRRAGVAYAINVLGCIVGPLMAGFVLLPWVGEPLSVLLAAAPLFGLGLLAGRRRAGAAGRTPRLTPSLASAGVVAVGLFLAPRTYESRFSGATVLRDSTATVATYGQGMQKHLLVNGIGMTYLTPITKMMVHLPLTFQAEPPRSALIICFGMGTSFRSALSWGLDTTAVELVPSVPAAFGFFHPDAPALLKLPNAHVVIDDGRRFLERSNASYDLVVVDPPPPVSAAGSSLLYSREFCDTVKKRLTPHGIFQQWIPSGDGLVVASITRALLESFPHVRGFTSVEGWGLHLLASREPIPDATAATLAGRLPPAAARDLIEWGPADTPEAQLRTVLEGEVRLDQILALAPRAPALHDDRPVNEYFLLRRLRLR